MKNSLLLILILTCNSYASFPEMFAPSASTLGLVGQMNDRGDDPANNYYAPSLLSFSKRPQISLNASYNQVDFESIQNIQTKNMLTSEENRIGDIDTDYDASTMGAYHFLLPILKEEGSKLAISVYAPLDSFQESSTGDPYLPEYVMYRSRQKRTNIYVNWISEKFSQDWAYSLGFFSGMQISGETDIAARYNGTNKPSSAKMKFKATPSISPILSITKKSQDFTFFTTYQHQMKNKLKVYSIGATRDTAVNFPFEFTMSSLLYFDPSTLRMGFVKPIAQGKFFSTLEFQYWKPFKTSVVGLEQNSGFIVGSGNYEKIETRNIIIPKLGYEFMIKDDLSAQMGIGFRPTPLKGNFAGAGNSIDSDAWLYGLGLNQKETIFNHLLDFSLGFELSQLKKKAITKTPGLEDGASGNKIGSPGYSIGGTIMTLMGGIKLEI